jgi:cytochrome c-type biogenesis protein CcmH/NrfG
VERKMDIVKGNATQGREVNIYGKGDERTSEVQDKRQDGITKQKRKKEGRKEGKQRRKGKEEEEGETYSSSAAFNFSFAALKSVVYFRIASVLSLLALYEAERSSCNFIIFDS